MSSDDPTSLDNLHDIVPAPPIPFWPPAPGWYVVGGIVLATALWLAWKCWRRWNAAAYRRAALAELRTLEERAAISNSRGDALAGLASLLKRTALAAFPRETVASLSGDEWLQFLDKTGKNDAFSRGTGRVIEESTYDPRASERLDSRTMTDLFDIARRWISGHKTT